MAELRDAVANVGDGTTVAGKEVIGLKAKIEEFATGKDGSSSTDLPQDYLPISPSAGVTNENIPTNASSSNENGEDSPAGSCSAANKHMWVSPNKSDEVPSSQDSSPATQPEQAAPGENEHSIEESNAKESPSSTKAEFGGEYDADSDPAAEEEHNTGLDLSIVGQSMEIQNSEILGVASDEAVLGASGKDFAKIIHGDREVMLVMPSEVSCALGSTTELSNILAESLGITDEIIGLTTTAMLLDDTDCVSKHHGEVIIPFSALASGQLRRLVDDTDFVSKHHGKVCSAEGLEGIPSFNLVTANFDKHQGGNQLTTFESEEESSQGEDSNNSISVREGALYTEAFVDLMEKSEEFDPFEKNCLLRFGIDCADQGNVLFRAAYRVAVYTGDMKYFIQGLKAIAKMLLDGETSPTTNVSEGGGVGDTKPTSMRLFGMMDFVISADELFESDDLSAPQYVTLLHAFFAGHSSVQSLFDLYHNPDFLLACDGDAELRGSLCLRDLLHLGKKLELLQPKSQDDEPLKWAIRTGIHNFAQQNPAQLPQEFVNIIYHMFSSGDEMVLAACQAFVRTSDSEAIEDMIGREWGIYNRNKAFREEMADDSSFKHPAPDESSSLMRESSLSKASCAYSEGEFPDTLLTATALLVNQNEISEDSATALLSSYAHGNELMRDVYDHFIEFGGVDDFLGTLKLIASMDLDTIGTPRTSAVEVLREANESEDNIFRDAIDNMRTLGQVEISALRLAAVRKDPHLTKALADFREGVMDTDKFQQALRDVIDCVIQETDIDLTEC